MDKSEPTEEMEQKALVIWLKQRKIHFFSVPNENLFTTLLKKYLPKNMIHLITVIEKRLALMGKRKGVSDLVIFLPNKIMFLELKRRHSGTATKEQKEFLSRVNDYHYAIGGIAHGWVEASAMIEYYMEQK